MDEFLSKIILDNSVRNLLVVAIIILLVFVIKRYLSRYIAGLFFRILSLFTRNVDRKEFVSLVVVPLEIFLWILTIIISLDKLKFPSAFEFDLYHISSRNLFDAVGRAILIITFIWFLLKVIDFVALVLKKKAMLTPDATDDQLVVFFKDFFKTIMVILGILMTLKFVFNYNIGTLITGLSIATAAIALATKESLENLIASFIIFFDKPFTLGDLVKVHNVTGTVEKIGLRSTRIRTDNKTFVTVPNKQMVDSILDNLTLRTHRKAETTLELSSASTKEQLQVFIESTRKLLQQRRLDSFSVYLNDVSKDAFVLKIEYLTTPIPMDDFNTIKQEINLGIIELMELQGIKLAERNFTN